jgi:hypothetical protein
MGSDEAETSGCTVGQDLETTSRTDIVNDTAGGVSLLGKTSRVAQSVEESSDEPESTKDRGSSGVVQTYENSAWIIGV